MRSSIFLYVFFFVFVLTTACDKDDDEDNSSNGNANVVPNNFLSSTKYDKLIVEVQYVNGFQPSTAAVNNLKTFLEARLNKPSGISITQTAIASPSKSAYSADDIRAIEKANRSQQTADKTLTAYFFFADGDYAGNSGSSKVLGIAYGATSMAIFEKTIKDNTGGIGQPSLTTVESTVIHHEFAHILGLVNNGTSMQAAHQDEPHGKHCTNQDCLMYYAVETSDFLANLTGGTVPSLDTNCINDLKANGGK